MAHANPEFALGLMRPERGLVSHQLPAPASLADLRRRMIEIGECIRYDVPHSAEEAEAYWVWRTTQRQARAHAARDRQLSDAVSERPNGTHGRRRSDERVYEPLRRSPVDVQAGRPAKPRRGTLER